MITVTARCATATIAFADRAVIIKISGRIDGPTLLELTARLGEHATGEAGYSVLADLSDADLSGVCPDDVRHVALLPTPHAQAVRYAIVVPGDLGFGFARMFASLRGANHAAIHVFRGLEEARRWIADDDATTPEINQGGRCRG